MCSPTPDGTRGLCCALTTSYRERYGAVLVPAGQSREGRAIAIQAAFSANSVLTRLGVLLRWSALIASLVLTVFFAVLIRVWSLGMQVDCGCFGSGEGPLGPLRLFEEALMLAVGVAVTIAAFRRTARSA